MLLDNSIALLESQNDGTAYDTIVLFELKKPMRSDLTTNNPVDQIIGYMEKFNPIRLPIETDALLERTNTQSSTYMLFAMR